MKTPGKTSSETEKVSTLEHIGGWIDGLRAWGISSWKIALRMTKGAYLLSERRRLFKQLGEEVYYKIQKGEMRNADLEPVVDELNRLTKKVELEERQIRQIRFGNSSSKADEDSSEGLPLES
jgi:hypothetical protein